MSPNSKIRVGCVPYLVARPLISGLDTEKDFSLHLEVPSSLVQKLRLSEIDVALASSIEIFRAPGYSVVPRLAIAADGEVLSVRLFLRKPIEELRSIALDPSSETAAALLRIVVREKNNHSIHYVPVPKGEAPESVEADAYLRIGDEALRQLEQGKLTSIDLAQAWKEITGLPFVFALWMVRPGLQLREKMSAFHRAAERGLAQREKMVREAVSELKLAEPFLRRYLLKACYYELGKKEVEALCEFRDRAAEFGLARRDLDIHFQV